ncbi:hypothetical protein CVT24_011009 [Panaeolus cyanescens]|uniref:DUF6532 domain-containing protein n=1 Tax=Panaeolus cyanescens TaxID=181874 RepID=A0A409WQ74_9AGAR|nr:hypothetical protein CVT24_011009 [Panaeolus cyanescens]
MSAPKFQSIIKTRNKNKEVHPGQVVVDSGIKRRTPEEMQRVREEKEAQKQRHTNNIIRAALVMDEQAAEDQRRRQAPAIPPLRLPYAAPLAADTAAAKEAQKAQRFAFQDPDNPDADPDYQPLSDQGESEVEDNSEVASDNDSVLSAAPKKRGRQRVGRLDIESARSHCLPNVSSNSSTAITGGKRRADSSTSANPPKLAIKKSKSSHGSQDRYQSVALLDGWKNQPTPLPLLTPASASRSDSDSMMSMVKVTHRNLTPVVLSKKQQHGGDKKWSLKHLPGVGTGDKFKSVLVPLAKVKVAASANPWMSLSVEEVQELVNAVFPDEEFTVEDDDVWCGLISYRLSNWRNAFATHAQEAVQHLINAELAADKDLDIAKLVEEYTTPHGSPYATTPYMWREWILDPDTGKITKRGRLQNRLVLFALAHAHFIEFDEIPDPSKLQPEEWPCGALVLAIQAVQHAFTFWTSGEFVKPSGPASHFSSENYGDSYSVKTLPSGQEVRMRVPKASLLFWPARALTAEQWEDIYKDIKVTLEYLSNRRRRRRSRSVSSAPSSDIIDDPTVQELVFESDNSDGDEA